MMISSKCFAGCALMISAPRADIRRGKFFSTFSVCGIFLNIIILAGRFARTAAQGLLGGGSGLMGGTGGVVCPPGMRADGYCGFGKWVCLDPKETCYGQTCCQPSDTGIPTGTGVNESPYCPIGTLPNGYCGFPKMICVSFQDRCVGNVCCKPQDLTNVATLGGMGGMGMPMGYGGMGGMGGYPMTSGMGYGGMNSMLGYGGMGGNLMGYGGGMGGMMGGMGRCTDMQQGCMMFTMYCNYGSVVEVCMGTCLCGMGEMGIGGMGINGMGMSGMYG